MIITANLKTSAQESTLTAFDRKTLSRNKCSERIQLAHHPKKTERYHHLVLQEHEVGQDSVLDRNCRIGAGDVHELSCLIVSLTDAR